jgi:hypothetical protein
MFGSLTAIMNTCSLSQTPPSSSFVFSGWAAAPTPSKEQQEPRHFAFPSIGRANATPKNSSSSADKTNSKKEVRVGNEEVGVDRVDNVTPKASQVACWRCILESPPSKPCVAQKFVPRMVGRSINHGGIDGEDVGCDETATSRRNNASHCDCEGGIEEATSGLEEGEWMLVWLVLTRGGC